MSATQSGDYPAGKIRRIPDRITPKGVSPRAPQRFTKLYKMFSRRLRFCHESSATGRAYSSDQQLTRTMRSRRKKPAESTVCLGKAMHESSIHRARVRGELPVLLSKASKRRRCMRGKASVKARHEWVWGDARWWMVQRLVVVVVVGRLHLDRVV